MSDTIPENPSGLFDLLRLRFGIGDWDEATAKVPWHKFRAIEAGKLKRMLARRRCTIEDVVLAADYAQAHNRPITATWQIFELVVEARREKYRAMKAAPTPVREQLEAAAAEAHELGRSDWAARLYATETPFGQDVLAQWAEVRDQ